MARLREPKELDRSESRKKPGAPTQARARPQPARGLPGATSAPSPPPLAGRGGARAQKTPTSERAPAHPQLPARARRADRGRAANARRPGAGAGGPGQAPRGGGPGREHGGRGAESYSGSQDSQHGRKKEFLKIGNGPPEEARNGKAQGTARPHSPRSGPRPPLTRAARKATARPLSEGGRAEAAPGRRVSNPSTRARVATASAPSASLGSAPRAARAPRRTDRGASPAAASPSLGRHHRGERGEGECCTGLRARPVRPPRPRSGSRLRPPVGSCHPSAQSSAPPCPGRALPTRGLRAHPSRWALEKSRAWARRGGGRGRGGAGPGGRRDGGGGRG